MSDVNVNTEKELPISNDYFAGKQAEILKELDKKNVDTEDLEAALLGALATYEAISDGVESSAGTTPTPNPA
jgi:hypothetical protein